MSQIDHVRAILVAVSSRLQAMVRGGGLSGIDLSSADVTYGLRPVDLMKYPPHIYLAATRVRSEASSGSRRAQRRRTMSIQLDVLLATPGDEESEQHGEALALLQEIVDGLEADAWELTLEAVPGVQAPEILSIEGGVSPIAAHAGSGRAVVATTIIIAYTSGE